MNWQPKTFCVDFHFKTRLNRCLQCDGGRRCIHKKGYIVDLSDTSSSTWSLSITWDSGPAINSRWKKWITYQIKLSRDTVFFHKILELDSFSCCFNFWRLIKIENNIISQSAISIKRVYQHRNSGTGRKQLLTLIEQVFPISRVRERSPLFCEISQESETSTPIVHNKS